MSTRQQFSIDRAVARLRKMARQWQLPIVTEQAECGRNPFRVLISTILSSRTKDKVTGEASDRLFARADTPDKMLDLTENEIAHLIYPVGFYNTKARLVRNVCKALIEQHEGTVPSDMTDLLNLPGVGRKTANLVITLGFCKPGICVDTHVHRISNRWGVVRTKTPEKTEQALRKTLPRKYWIEFNSLLVAFGQNICTPISPRCSECSLDSLCPKTGVKKHR